MPPIDPKVEIRHKITQYQGTYRIDRYHLRHRLFQGGWSDEMSREVFERGHIVAVVLFDPNREELVLIEQFRSGAYAAGWQPWLVEIVAGGVESGESAEDVARRETVEEAGCDILALEPLCKFLSIPAACSETTEIYCGLVDSAHVGGIHGLDSEHEDIRVFSLPVQEAFVWLDNGRIVNARTMIGLQWFRQRYEAIREAWRD